MGDARAILAVAAPLFAGAAILLWRRVPPRLATYAAAGVSFAMAALLLSDVRAGAGQAPEARILAIAPGLALALRVDALGLTFGLLASGLFAVSAFYSSGYARAMQLRSERRYFACYAIAVGAALGVAFARDVLTFFVFYEALTFSTYPLVAHEESERAVRAGRVYLAYTVTGGLLLLGAAAWTYAAARTLDFAPGGFLAGRAGAGETVGLFALYMLGCGVKAAIMPLHAWLPEAMVAPTPVSALLHSVAVVKAGVFGCLRALGYVVGPEALAGTGAPAALAGMCLATIVAASLLAIGQDHLKRRLAYSTVAHLSYVVLGAALLSPQGMAGAVLHLANHGIAKIALFFCAGAIHAGAHVENVSELRGLGRRMPWTFGAFAVASLALVGAPGLCGFTGKLLIARGALEAGNAVALGGVLLGSLLAAAYLLPILRIAFFASGGPPVRAPLLLVAPAAVAAALAVVFGAWPAAIGVQYDLAARAAAAVFGGGGGP